MAPGEKKAISRIRTFEADVSHARGKGIQSRPKLKEEKVSAQQKADALLKSSSKDTLPKRAKELKKKKKPRTSNEFLAASDNTLPIKKEQSTEKKTATTVTKTAPKPEPIIPREIPVSSTQQQNITVEQNTLVDEIRSIQEKQNQATTFEDIAEVSLHEEADDGGAVIIENKKKNRFKLFPAIGSSLRRWALEQKNKITREKAPEHVVNKATTRIETISAAARGSHHAPQSDHGIVVKRLAKKKRIKKETALSVKKKEDIAPPSWTYIEDDTRTSNPQPTPAPQSTSEPAPQEVSTPETSAVLQEVDTELKKRVVSNNTPKEEHSPTSFFYETADSSPQVEQTQKPIEQPVETATPEPTSPPVSPPVSPQLEPKPVMTPTLAQTPQQTVVPISQEVAVPQKTRKYSPAPVESSSRVPIYIYILVIIGASLLGIGTSVYWFISVTPAEQTVAIAIPSLIVTSQQNPVPLGTTRSETYENMISAAQQTNEIAQLYPTVTDSDNNMIPAKTPTILQNLQWHTPGSFTRAITEITFGSYNGTEPFIIMRITNFDTAFAGMLEWEPTMSTDLAPLFGLPVTESYDPYIRTDTQIRSAFFRDSIVANKSTRMLVDANRTERIVYSFVNQNILIITTNSETLSVLLPVVSQ